MHMQASQQGISRELGMGKALPRTMGNVGLWKMERHAGARSLAEPVRYKTCGMQTKAVCPSS